MIKKLLSVYAIMVAAMNISFAQIQGNQSQLPNQHNSHWCASDQVNQEYIEKIDATHNLSILTPNNSNSPTKSVPKITSYLPSPSSFGTGSGKASLRTIPIVVHVVHNPSNPAENVSDALIYDMIDYLNQTFRAQNSNISNVRAIFKPDTADVHIEFCLASKDPFGAATTGITRTSTTEDWYDKDSGETNKMKDDATGGKSGWPSTDYLNVWICNITNGAGFGTAGYAYLPTPGMHGSSIDGLVLDYDIGIGYGNTTATHEIGHYMGLNHTWGPSESCGNDDGFSDTPNCGGPNYFCPTSANSCGTPNGDQIENFMDYADCAYMFTNEQAAYMNNILSTTRSSLLASDGCEPVAPPTADFSATPLQVVVNGSAQFTDLSTGIPDTWSWNISPGTHTYINGTNSSSQNPKVQFTATGFYNVTLTASNSLGSDDEIKTAYIEVITAPVCAGGIFCEDFSGGGIPAGWSTTANAGTDVWVYSTTGAAGPFSIGPIASTTAADGFMLFDSDALCSGNQDADLETPPIDCSTSPGVILEFEQYYRKYYDSTFVYVSNNNGVSWDTYRVNETFVDGSNNFTLNPDLVRIDISATAAFQSSVIVKWNFWSPSGAFGGFEGCGYAWMIDDVLLYEPPQYDASAVFGFPEYSQIPELQKDPIDLQLYVENTGWDNITGVSATINVYDDQFTQVYSGTTNTIASIASGSAALVSVTGGWTPSDTGSYFNEYIVSIAETDGDVSNDTLYSDYFYYVGDTTYAKDYISQFAGALGVGGANLIFSQKFEVQTTDYLNSISAYLFPSSSPSSVGDVVTYQVYNMAGGYPTGAPIASSSPHTITVADTTGGAVYLTLSINGGPVQLTPGDYAIAVSDQTGNGNIYVGYTDMNWYPNTAFIDINGGGHNELDAYGYYLSWIIRANFVSCDMVFNESSTQVSCGAIDGTASVAPTGAIAPYTYNWLTTPAQTGATATGLDAGTYQVVITDDRGCERGTSVQVTSAGGTILLSTSVTEETCGNSGGTATISASGGTGTYSYAWSGTAQTNPTITGLTAGTYNVTVTDAGGCSESTDFYNQAVVSNSVPTIVVTPSSTDEVCVGANGTATGSASGGTAPYTYQWDASAGSQNATIATGLAAATYSVTATDLNGCVGTGTVTVNNDPGSFTVTNSCSSATTTGGSEGSSTTTPSGGTGPYTYSWSPAPATGQNSATATGLPTGLYSVTVTDGNGCVASDNCSVTEPTCAITLSSATSDEICIGSNGTITITPSGGSAPYTYNWEAATGTQSASSGVATGLAAGTYSVTVTDASLCDQSTSATVNNNAGTLGTLNSCGNTSAAGASDGTSTTTPTGGTAPYNYAWSPSPAAGQTGAMATGLSSGAYSVTVTDANGCTTTGSCFVNDPGCAITISGSSTPATCTGSDGTATATPTGGSTPYGYQWDASAGAQSMTSGTATGLTSGVYAVTVADITLCVQISSVSVSSSAGTLTASNSCSPTSSIGASDGSSTATPSGGTGPYSYAWSPVPALGQTGATATGLNAGTYSVTVTDANGCEATSNCAVADPGCAISVSTSSTPATCSGSDGTATATPTGGSAPYGFMWDASAGTQSMTSGTATGLVSGTYMVTVVDMSMCVSITSVNVSSSAGTLSASLVCSGTSGVGLSDGSSTATPIGGSAPYSYVWSPAPASGQTGATATGLNAGTYTVTITDNNGCTATDNCVIADPGCAITVTTSSTDVLCNGDCNGTGSAVAIGGSAPYTYAWDASAGAQSATSGNATGLCPGTYGVTITDNSGCTSTGAIIINEPTALLLSYTSVDESCGAANGSATIGASGGTLPYSYNWPSGGTAASESNLAAGVYVATVSDFNGCMGNVSVPINDVGSVSASITPDTSICQGQTLLVTAAGGTSYTWNTGSTNSFITVNTSGVYTCTVSTGGSCFDIVSTSISVNTIPSPFISASQDTVCPGQPVTLTASGAQSYTWTPSLQTGSSIVVYPTPSQPIYSVIGNNNGCIGNPTQYQIHFYQPLPTAVASANTTAIPVGGTVNFNATGSVADSFSWDFDGNTTTDGTNVTGSFTYPTQGIYGAVLTTSLSSGQCSATDTVFIYVGNVSIVEFGLENSVRIFPNPTTGKLNVSLNLTHQDDVEISVFNSIGEIIEVQKLSEIESSVFELDITDNARGVYFVRIKSSNEVVTKKVTLVK